MPEHSGIPCWRPGHTRAKSGSVSRSHSSSTSFSVSTKVQNAKAQRVSDMIDEQLKREGARRQIEVGKEVKVLLLGQAESGKSTLRKQFQLYHASHTLDMERPSWRIVVYANLIKALRTILEELDYEFSLSLEEYPCPSEGSGPTDVAAQNEINELRRNLLPLISLEGSLSSELSDGVTFVGHRRGTLFPACPATFTRSSSRPLIDLRGSSKALVATNRAAQVLGTSVDAAEALWGHRSVQFMLRLRKLRLDEAGHFFLDHLQRIAQPDYVPTTDDLLHVRLQTVGVIEHSLKVNTVGVNYNWKIYDVGGAQRPAWCPYFDDVNTLIFLAPISAFDQYLEEDPLTNRVHDSLQLVTSICANKLLKNAQLVLLLNKTDILRRKLEAGIQVRQYITSYGDRPNNYATVAEYFRTHFVAAHKKEDIARRRLYVHFTSMLDVQATQIIIVRIGDTIMRKHIAQTGLA
ncbi:G-protein alpha subunit [Mycena sp. CBHHK59/15]|nr:G-protein alpha subunit [Mycena sp. CBHHK59/15]